MNNDGYISGSIRKIIYESQTGYKVGLFKVRETSFEEYKSKVVSFVGTFSSLDEDVDYEMNGYFTEHPKYGLQFNVTSYKIKLPSDTDSIMIYLSSGAFKGVGIKTAKKLVDKYGIETINILKNDYESISEEIMSRKKTKELHDKLVTLTNEEEIILSLNSMGFSTKDALSLLGKYGPNLLNIIKDNIYLLKDDIRFSKLDEIYLKSNDAYDEVRVLALIEYIINALCYKNGNTLVYMDEVYLNLNKFFNNILDSSLFSVYIDKMVKYNKLLLINDKVVLKDYYDTEKYISNRIKAYNSLKEVEDENKIDELIDKYSKNYNIIFNDEQRNAIKGSIINNFFIISGGPGTGKTTIVNAIIKIYDEIHKINFAYDLALLAPTGRASKRLTESSGIKASTIHKFLKWNKETEEFNLNENNKSEVSFVIIDEASMIDIFLMKSLLKALKQDIKLILVGDNNQLPSISPGNVLGDLITIDNIKKTILTHIYRTKENSYINILASEIKSLKVFDNFGEYDDFSFIPSSDDNIKYNLENICSYVIKNKISLDEFQVLAPMYKTQNGIDSLNALMQNIFNPKSKNKKEIVYANTIYRENDKVLQLVNDIDNNVFNGDIGYIVNIVGNEVLIDYSGTVVSYKPQDYEKFTHAYAISVHKSQGSEYYYCVVILSSSFKRMFYNKLLYTAVTRAKKKLILIGTIDNINTCVQTLYSSSRDTLLKTFF